MIPSNPQNLRGISPKCTTDNTNHTEKPYDTLMIKGVRQLYYSPLFNHWFQENVSQKTGQLAMSVMLHEKSESLLHLPFLSDLFLHCHAERATPIKQSGTKTKGVIYVGTWSSESF